MVTSCRMRRSAICCALGILLAGSPRSLLAAAEPAIPTSTFLGSIGIVSTFPDRGQPLARTIEMIRYCGFRWVRAGIEGLSDEGPTTIQTFLDLHRETGVLLSWGLVVTRGPDGGRQNIGIYRQQPIGRNRLIMRWLAHRGGALDYQAWQAARPGEPFPVAVVIGADPATLLAAVMPIPDGMSEYQFAGLLRGERTELVTCADSGLDVPARAEIVLEGVIVPGDEADEGPFGDHTGYYNETERYPVLTVQRPARRRAAISHSARTGRPADQLLDDLAKNLEAELKREEPKQLSLFSEDERTQLRRDRLALEARLRRIPDERERERLAIEERHTGLFDHTFPVSVILLVPESLATRRKS